MDHVINTMQLPFKDPATGFGVEREEMPTASRHYLAMKKLIDRDNFDGLAIRCWPELPGPQVRAMERKLLSCSQSQGFGQQAGGFLIGCTRVNTQ